MEPSSCHGRICHGRTTARASRSLAPAPVGTSPKELVRCARTRIAGARCVRHAARPARPSAARLRVTTPTTRRTATAPTTPVIIEITENDGKITPDEQGRQGRRSARRSSSTSVSDVDDEIHVHSDPEHEFEVTAGEDKTFTFTIDTPGHDRGRVARPRGHDRQAPGRAERPAVPSPRRRARTRWRTASAAPSDLPIPAHYAFIAAAARPGRLVRRAGIRLARVDVPRRRVRPSAAGRGSRASSSRRSRRGRGRRSALLFTAWVDDGGAVRADTLVNPTFGTVYVLLWVGLVPAALLFGPVYRLCNPLRWLHRGICRRWPASTHRRGPAGLSAPARPLAGRVLPVRLRLARAGRPDRRRPA